jgi:hypothetical protein
LWGAIHQYAFQHDYNVVCKQNSGSGGKGVFHTKTPQDLEHVVHELFTKYPAISLSPFHEILHEYRVIMIDGEPKIIFDKIRPHIVADGKRTTQDLVIEYSQKTPGTILFKLLGEIDQEILFNVLPKGKLIHLNWKHNLTQGAQSQLIAIPTSDQLATPPRAASTRASRAAAAPALPGMKEIHNIRELIDLAKMTVKAIGVRVASVDIAELKGGKLKDLEVNAGTMLENTVLQNGEMGLRLATDVYEEIVMKTFGEGLRPSSADDSPACTTDHSPASSRSDSPLQRTPQHSPILGPTVTPPSPPRKKGPYHTPPRLLRHAPPSPPQSSQDVEMES